MSTLYYEGKVPMSPNWDEIELCSDDDDVCCLMVPEIYYEVVQESCEEEPAYGWHRDVLAMVKNQCAVRYIESTGIEVLLKNKYGESEWVNGGVADILGIDIEEREDERVVTEYIVEVCDLEKGEMKRGKVVFGETLAMDEYDLRKVGKCGSVISG